MTDVFRYEAESAPYVFEAVIIGRNRSPFTKWFGKLDGAREKAIVVAGFENLSAALGSGSAHGSGRLDKLNDELDEIRLTKKGRRGGPHIRAAVPRETVRLGGTFWLLVGFKKQTDRIDDNDIEKAMNVLQSWRRI